MVVKMMKWPPWLSVSSSTKYEVKIVIKKVEGIKINDGEKKKMAVEIKWKGRKSNGRSSIALGALGKSLIKKREFTEEGGVCGDGVVEWNQEFVTICNLSVCKHAPFYPWKVEFTVFHRLHEEPRNSVFIGTASLDLAEFASKANLDHEISFPLIVPSKITENNPSLSLSLRLTELGTVQEPPQVVPSLMQLVPPSPASEQAHSPRKEELSSLKASLRKVRIFTSTKKACHDEANSDSKKSDRGEDAEYPFDIDSLDGDDESESEKSNRDSKFRLPFNYKTLANAKFPGCSHPSSTISDASDEGWIFYKNPKTDLHVGEATVYEHSLRQSSKRRILSWKKRAFNFSSAKPKVKGEPLLKKDYGEIGGDDIDFDRRQLNSSDESSLGWNQSEDSSTTSRSSVSEFGVDHFTVGNWELKEVISRDGHMKLQAQVFFASIDQRSERATGESACSALVAVIADWLQSNPFEVPIKSEFDRLIEDGSLEWRNMCDSEDYKQRFPDKHFDLETVLEAKIRPLSVVAEKSFIGFFHPGDLEGGDFDFLHGSMSFDSIWEEISCSNDGPVVYIISWNDHFFVLKVEQDAYYIVDTLGERLYEGCNQAYALKFDKDTIIQRLPIETDEPDKKSANDKSKPSLSEAGRKDRKEEILCKGKESCKEYIKSFLAAIPIREMQADIKKGLIASTSIHHRLQIEFHYTNFTESTIESFAT